MSSQAKEHIEAAILDWLDGEVVAPTSMHDSNAFIVSWKDGNGTPVVKRISITRELTDDLDAMIESDFDEQFSAALELIEDHVRALVDQHTVNDNGDWTISEAILHDQHL